MVAMVMVVMVILDLLACAAGDEAVAVTMLSLAVDKLLSMARVDEDRQVVMTILDSTNEMLDEIKKPVLDAVESPDVFISLIKDVFQQKVLEVNIASKLPVCASSSNNSSNSQDNVYDAFLIAKPLQVFTRYDEHGQGPGSRRPFYQANQLGLLIHQAAIASTSSITILLLVSAKADTRLPSHGG